MLAANAHLAPGYAGGLKGIARSMPTSAAADRVAEKLGIGMLRDADRLEVLRQSARCRHGRRSAARKAPAPAPTTSARRMGCGRCCCGSTSSPCASESVEGDRRRSTGPTYGRNYYSRHDYEEVETDARQRAGRRAARASSPRCPGSSVGGLKIAAADDFAYHDPVDGSVQQATRASASCSRAARASCSACPAPAPSGATLRVYIERYEPDPASTASRRRQALADLMRWRPKSPASGAIPAATSRPSSRERWRRH